MKRNITLFAATLVLIFSVGTVQAHGSLLGIFFKHHAHYACGHHYNDHGPDEVYQHIKHKRHEHHKHHGYHVHKEKKFIW